MWVFPESQKVSHEAENDSVHLQELFQQWENCYQIDVKIIEEAFKDSEKELLKTFDKAIMTCGEKLGGDFPGIEAYHTTNDWKTLNRLAVEILKAIK